MEERSVRGLRAEDVCDQLCEGESARPSVHALTPAVILTRPAYNVPPLHGHVHSARVQLIDGRPHCPWLKVNNKVEVDDEDGTPTFWAAQAGREADGLAAVKMLAKLGADPRICARVGLLAAMFLCAGHAGLAVHPP